MGGPCAAFAGLTPLFALLSGAPRSHAVHPRRGPRVRARPLRRAGGGQDLAELVPLLVDRGDDQTHRHADIDQHRLGELQARLDRLGRRVARARSAGGCARRESERRVTDRKRWADPGGLQRCILRSAGTPAYASSQADCSCASPDRLALIAGFRTLPRRRMALHRFSKAELGAKRGRSVEDVDERDKRKDCRMVFEMKAAPEREQVRRVRRL